MIEVLQFAHQQTLTYVDHFHALKNALGNEIIFEQFASYIIDHI